MGLYKSFFENKGEEEIFSKKSLGKKIRFFFETQKERIEYNREGRRSLREAKRAKKNFYYGPSSEPSPIRESENPWVKRTVLGLVLGSALIFGGLKLGESYFLKKSSQKIHSENVGKPLSESFQEDSKTFSFDRDTIQNNQLEVEIKDYSFENISVLGLDEMKQIGRSKGIVGLLKEIINDDSRVYYKDLKKGGKFYELALASGGVDLEKENVSLEKRAGLEINGINDYLSEQDIEKMHDFFYGKSSLCLDEEKTSFNNLEGSLKKDKDNSIEKDDFSKEKFVYSGNSLQEMYDSLSEKVRKIQFDNKGLIPKKDSLEGQLRKEYIGSMKYLEDISKKNGYSLA